MTGRQVVDAYFMEHRAKLLDIAAVLDRLDRAADGGGRDDVRIRALLRALPLLADGAGERTRRILHLLSDHSVDPVPAAHTQSALGADPRTAY
ncbi:MAG: hypothetical protein ACKOHG_20290 [Planctomycetia bacterium]